MTTPLLNLSELDKVKTIEPYTTKMTKCNHVVSLFCGIGGFDLGFKANGFDVIWANDFDKWACKTYSHNVDKEVHCGDIRELKGNIPQHDILIGGFPCQPFSTCGLLKGFEDTRGTLFFEIADILKQHKTKVVCLENVANLKYHDGGRTFKVIIKTLEDLGYNMFYKILNTKHYGIPQNRRRVFIVGFNKEYFNNVVFKFPQPIGLDKTVFDLLDKEVGYKYFLSYKLLKTLLCENANGYKIKPTINTPIAKTIICSKYPRAHMGNYYTDEVNYAKLTNEQKANKSNMRRLTENEVRQLQGFPDTWEQVVSDRQAYKQFGNAVSVNVSTVLAKSIREYIEINYKENK